MEEAKRQLIASMKNEVKRERDVARWLTDLANAGSLDKESATRQAALHEQVADGYEQIIETCKKRWGI